MIINNSGGGANLNFKVVGGTSEPADPKENTIWVNTEQAITAYAFSNEEPYPTAAKAGEIITLSDAADSELNGLKIFGRTAQDGTPTPDAPVELVSLGAEGSVALTAAGGQLFKPNEQTKTASGLTWECTDGLWHVYGTASSLYPRVTLDTPFLPEPGEYTISAVFVKGSFSGTGGRIAVCDDNATTYLQCGTGSPVGTKTLDKISFTRLILGNIPTGTTIDVQFYVMVNAGSSALPYEAYKEEQILDVSVPNGLPGIPVSYNGSYTDENGRQWICDEIDFGSAVLVQRINQVSFDGTENWYAYNSETAPHLFYVNVAEPAPAQHKMLCSHFPYDYSALLHGGNGCRFANASPTQRFYITSASHTSVADFKAWLAAQNAAGTPVTIAYKRDAAVEQALSDEELAVYAALHTNKPNTTIYNDSGAYMNVWYVKNVDFEGMVWFETAGSAAAPFNALKKNNITVYPTACKQNVGGQWLEKTARTYQLGAWQDWHLYLLNGGDVTANTGGWYFDSSYGGAELSVTSSGLYLSMGYNSDYWTYARCGKSADLTNYSTLHYYVESYGGGWRQGVGVMAAAKTGYGLAEDDCIAYARITAAGWNTLDVSSLGEDCYPVIYTGGSSSAVHISQMYFSR